MKYAENSNQENNEPTQVNSKKSLLKSAKVKIIVTLVAVAVFASAIGGVVWAKKKFRDGPHGFMIGMIVDKLNLTETQKTQVEKIKDEIKTKMESKKGNRDDMMEELANEFTKDNLDKNKLKELDQQRIQNEQEMKDFMLDKLVEFHNLLTPEQRTKAVELMKDMKNKFHDRGNHDGNRNGRPKDKRD